VKQIAELLIAAANPLLVAGGGARGASEEIRALADLGIPVLTTVNGKGVLDETHPSSLGASIRLPAAHRALNAADLLLVVGSELGDSDLWGGVVEPGTPGGRAIVRIDIDPAQTHKNVRADLDVVGDASVVLGAVLERLRAGGFPARSVDPATRKAIDAEAALDAGPWTAIQNTLRDALPENTVIAGDSSQVTYYGTVHHWPFTPANRLLYPTGFATLGYGLPAAIGAKVADPSRPVVALVGDGAAMFSIQEMATAADQRLPLPIVVVDNGGYAEIRDQMRERGIEPQAVDLPHVDLPAVARAMGGHGVRADDLDDLGRFAAGALEADVPTLIHHVVERE
jgi:acetolactate synthase-1/2/3 large subunit